MERLGYYEPRSFMGLITAMKLTSIGLLLFGVLFGIIVALFVAISVLLIYSLLMTSIESKNFENGVLRLLGLSKWNCVSMIFI